MPLITIIIFNTDWNKDTINIKREALKSFSLIIFSKHNVQTFHTSLTSSYCKYHLCDVLRFKADFINYVRNEGNESCYYRFFRT